MNNFTAALASIGDGVIVTALDGSITFINHAAERLTGWKSEQAVGRSLATVFRLIDIETRRPFADPFVSALAAGMPVGLRKNTVLVASDGSEWYVSANTSPVKNSQGDLEGVVVVFRDITQLKQVEQNLTDERKKLETIFDAVPSGILIIDEEGRIEEVNPAFARRFNVFQTGGHIGRSLQCNNSYLDERGCGYSEACTACPISQALHEVFTNGMAVCDFDAELTLAKSNREKLWFRINIIPVEIDKAGKAVVVIEDISRFKELEQILKEVAEAAYNANQAKSEFLANMSHEIRTPLNGIVGMIDLTLMSALTPVQQENLQIAKACAASLLDIINDILDFSKIEAGKVLLQKVGFDLTETVGQTLKLHTARAAEKGLKLECQFGENVPQFIVGDPLRLQQVLNNLVSNAIKFTSKGHVAVTIANVSHDGIVRLLFTVADTGIGIAVKEQQLLFKSFSQVDSSPTRQYNGTGLGLAISRQLVTMMGGNIWVDSVKGQGSSFHFTVQFENCHPLGSKALTNSLPQKLKTQRPRKILLAEDHKLNQAVTGSMLKEMGHAVTVAGTGVTAVDLYKQRDFDLILMDIQMPEMDGLEAAAIIRGLERGTGRHIPIIAITAHALYGDRERFLELGMDDYIAKPVQFENLFAIIENIGIAKASLSQELEWPFAKTEFVHLAPDCFESLAQQVSQLEEAVVAGNSVVIEHIALEIKSLAGKYSLDVLKNLAFRIALDIRRGSTEQAGTVAAQMVQEINSLRKLSGCSREQEE
ncbi:ATP-binding protein [Sporomusa aerivorans]|uniref:ATP-binding protein n=1 Tax=Sporomusa aerivorans TaxID=204936 RepID=UPI00352B745A